MTPWRSRPAEVTCVCIFLALAVFVVFGQTAGFSFVNYDDKSYIYQNPVVQQGLTLKGVAWAFTYGEIGHWHPLTWLTHMADCQVYGLWAGGHHLTNVALHALAAVLLFLALRELTGSLWRSAFVAAVFAVHPLRAESVAWVAERKDVLSGVFFMLALWAYARYARQPSRWRYAAVALAFALGLLSKNMLVTLPFVLLLLDWWPLHRLEMDRAGIWGLVKEKIPLFLLSIGSCVATALVPEKVFDYARVPFLERLDSALVSYLAYLRQMVFPEGLAIPYLYPPNGEPVWKVASALVLLTSISFLAVALRNRRPYLLVGWLWYLGMLVPVIGLIQISYYAHADRYTYLPGIGLLIAGTWAVAEWSVKWRHRRQALWTLSGASVLALMACASRQTTYWKSGETLWLRTLACTTSNYVGHFNFGIVLDQQGKLDEAVDQYEKVLEIKPTYADAHVNLGIDLSQMGRPDEAISHFRTAVQLNPSFAEAQNDLGNALMQKGELAEAVTRFQTALKLDPANANAENNFGNAMLRMGKPADALAHFNRAQQIDPNDPAAKNDMAWLLATSSDASFRDGRKAVALAEQANQLTQGGNPFVLCTLAASYAEAGRFPEAVETAGNALRLAEGQGNSGLAGALQTEINLYRTGAPLHIPAAVK